MSIIEKAVDKLADKDEQPKERTRLPEAMLEQADDELLDSLTSERVDETLSPDDVPEDSAVVPADGAAAGGARKQRPEFPRQTLKHAEIGFARLDAAGIITPETTRTTLVEQFRAIKRPLLMKAGRRSRVMVHNGNLMLVTSSLPGEGKTFTAINLAMSIVMELDHTVLLVDADVAKGDATRVLGIEETEGLVDYLAQPERSLSELLVKTSIEKLTVLPAGRPRSNDTELLASEDMRTLAEELARRYADRIIVFDSPPLLAASGASVLTQLAGQTVLVVEAVRTPQSAIREALGMLRSVQNVGLVLNKSRGDAGPGYLYGQYYPHGTGQT